MSEVPIPSQNPTLPYAEYAVSNQAPIFSVIGLLVFVILVIAVFVKSID